MSRAGWYPVNAPGDRPPSNKPGRRAPKKNHGVGLLVAALIVAVFAVLFYLAWQFLASSRDDLGVDGVTAQPELPPEPRTPPLSYEGFDPRNIISDAEFFDTGAYDLAQIEGFIQRWNDGCRSGFDGTPCLSDFREDSPSVPGDAYCPDGFAGEPGDTAPRIIWKSALSCGINPQVLLTTLQKEQGLITASSHRLNPTRYAIAMGYACPDDANCDPQYFGFATQVYYAARQFRIYEANPDMFMAAASREDFIPYAPGEKCGGSSVFVENLATANLYNYTPYQPNESVFNGTYDSCASVGNANFYAYFNAWFATPELAQESATPQSG